MHAVIRVDEGAIETMSVDTVQPSLAVQAVHRRQDATGNSGRDPPGDGKPRRSEKERQDRPSVFLNDPGQLTGKTINLTA